MAGRPRTFNRDVALEQAMRAFWEQGYAATTVSHLTQRIGIAAPSLYAAFGDNAFDVALLQAARVPVAVRPKARLRARAGEVAALVELGE